MDQEYGQDVTILTIILGSLGAILFTTVLICLICFCWRRYQTENSLIHDVEVSEWRKMAKSIGVEWREEKEINQTVGREIVWSSKASNRDLLKQA